MIKGVLARAEIERMVTATGLRPNFVDAAAAVTEQGAGNVPGGMLKGRQGNHRGGVNRQARNQLAQRFGGEVGLQVMRDQQDLVREGVDSQRRAAQKAARAAGERQRFLGDDLGIQRIEYVMRPEGCARVVRRGQRV